MSVFNAKNLAGDIKSRLGAWKQFAAKDGFVLIPEEEVEKAISNADNIKKELESY